MAKIKDVCNKLLCIRNLAADRNVLNHFKIFEKSMVKNDKNSCFLRVRNDTMNALL